MQMLCFNKKYFLLTILIFIIEVVIALYINDDFIRPYVGDILVVLLLFCFFKTFLKFSVFSIALFVLFFSFFIEFLQYINIVQKLGLEHSKTAKVVIGTSFSWIDLVCYFIGFITILIIEKYYPKKEHH
jgi:hypothetical protein